MGNLKQLRSDRVNGCEKKVAGLTGNQIYDRDVCTKESSDNDASIYRKITLVSFMSSLVVNLSNQIHLRT
jgi:hypothetical protein